MGPSWAQQQLRDKGPEGEDDDTLLFAGEDPLGQEKMQERNH